MADESQHPHNQQPFSYTNFSLAPNLSMQSYVPNHELFSLQAGMEMLEIPSKHHHNDAIGGHDHSLMIASEAMNNSWQQSSSRFIVDDDSSLRCLFPNTESSSRKLSLSLCNTEPDYHQQHQIPDGRVFGAYNQLENSVYLGPAQELLNEFCCLDGTSNSTSNYKQKMKKASNWEEGGPSSWNDQSLYSMDFLELQKLKVKLLSMVEEVDRRYKRYCEQMKAVVSSFEAVAGEGSATVYSTLASKAMSRHFRCLRDGIVSQIQATKKAMGEKDPVAPGTTKGETPRLKVLDRCLRQHKAFQQAGALESPPWRPQRGLPERAVTVLRAWLFEHFLHPYPSDVDKHILARQTGLSRSQVSNWFINARVRLWKPMVEEMYIEETKEKDNQSSEATADGDGEDKDIISNYTHGHELLLPNPNPNPSSTTTSQDQKPRPEHLIVESDSLSSIINTGNHRSGTGMHYRAHENYGAVDLDFSSYNNNQNFGSGVSLTLGLQQHSGGGMSMSFSPASQQSLYFSREQMDQDCQPVQFSILDGEAQNLPYRNLMGSQLLHDLAG